jgi:two-component sensor histidine kinase
MSESMTAIKEAFELEKKIKFPYSHYTTDMMALIYGLQGDDANYLSSALQSIRSVEATKDSFAYAHFCDRVSGAYDQIGKPNESLEWILKSVAEYKKKGDQQMQFALMNANNLLIALGKDSEAVALTQSLLREYPPVNPMDKQYHFLALGEGYFNLKEYALADKYYKEAEKLQKEVERLSGNTWNKYMYYKVGHYYFTIKQFEKSKRYFMEVLNDKSPTGVLPVGIAQIHKELYSIDSAAGRTTEADDHLKKYLDLTEVIYTEKQSKQIEQLKIQYETEKKDNDIRFLKQQEEIQQSQLIQTRLTKNIVIASIIVLALLMALLYSRYRIKQHHNRELEIKQQEINQKNTALENLIKDKDVLIADKDVLLKEKEWLIKEIHHRVKNNLQMVISLLNTQSKYLDNKEAIAAIGESRHRMQAMSLIHQKLYQGENTAIVNMQNYIRELTEYLRTSFNTNKRIYFDLQVKDIELDIAQAIPIGLILNETITNAIKYAFRFIENGMIAVIMKSYNDNTMLLEISDNGSGLPNDFDIDTSNSMGMRLIKGLVKQINGKLFIENGGGLKISVEFKADTHLKSISREELLKEPRVFA